MTAMTAPGAAPRASRVPRINGKQTFGRALRSEWIKLRSLRSTWITSAIAMAITVLFGAGIAIATSKSSDPETAATAGDNIINGTPFGQIAVAVLAALIITGEYSTGQIRSTLMGVPRRRTVFLAKTIVISIFSLALGSVSILLSWAISAPFAGNAQHSFFDAHHLGFIWGAGLAFSGIALASVGVGFLCRSIAASITIILVALFVLDIPVQILAYKWDWMVNVQAMLPLNVSGAVSDPFGVSHTWGVPGTSSCIEQWQAVAVFAAWALIPLLGGWLRFWRSDA